MKKKLKLTKKTLKNVKLKLNKASDRKAAPLMYFDPSNGSSC